MSITTVRNNIKRTIIRVTALALIASFGQRTGQAAEQAGPDQASKIFDAAGIPGGLIVHLGCGDGRLTGALGESGKFIVHGLDNNADAVAEARRSLYKKGLHGRTSVRLLTGGSLPHVDNLVNLLVVEKPLGVGRDEQMRVLAPLGVLLTRKAGGWEKTVKPWPDNIDEWTHYLHGPDNNAVARDSVVAPPRRLQWIADPRHLRSHEHLNSLSALVSARGRIFYIIDEGPVSAVVAPSQWKLAARDAFNGTLLWKRDIGPWEGHFRIFRSGPPEIGRRLVAVGDRVYATLGYGKGVAAFDAATGETVREYGDTAGAVEILLQGGRLFVLVGEIDKEAWDKAASRYYPTPPPRNKSVVALDAKTGQFLWRVKNRNTESILPATLAAADGGVFFQNTRQVVCLEAASGDLRWCGDRPVYTTRLSWSTPTLVARDGVVLSADGSTGGVPADVRRGEDRVKWIISDRDIRKHPPGDVVAFSAKTGERLWTGDALQGFCSPGDLFVIDGRVWAGAKVGTGQQTLDVALDLKSGEVKSRVTERAPAGGHTRCYRNKATERFLVLGGIGVEMVDVNDWSFTSDPWVRGSCQYGVMPCNGLLYVPPDSCACRPNARLHGFTAMAGGKSTKEKEQSANTDNRLKKGPAYEEIPHSTFRIPHSQQWPTYRNDPGRSGATKAAVAAKLRPAWDRKIGGRLSAPTVGEGKVFVSQIDAHTVHAVDVETGKIAWSRFVEGPVDSPPTVTGGLAVFGSRDGCVYCLRASDGELVWRFRAAPRDELLVAHERVESVWPVHGSVLERDGLVWFAAGRSSFLDGGIRLIALDARTGEISVEKRLDGRDSNAWPNFKGASKSGFRDIVPGTLPDILSAKGDRIFMGWTCFDGQGEMADVLEPHLFSATGFLDDTWWHRTYWQYGSWMRGGFGGWPQAARKAPAGRLMVFNDNAVFGFGREKYDSGNPEAVHAGHVGVIKNTYQDSGRVDHSQNPQRLFSAVRPGTEKIVRRGQNPIQYNWQAQVPMLVRAMVLADQTLWIAGPEAGKDNVTLAEIQKTQPGLLWAVSAADGTYLKAYNLAASPVPDGMSAIAGRLFISCTDGTVRCLAE